MAKKKLLFEPAILLLNSYLQHIESHSSIEFPMIQPLLEKNGYLCWTKLYGQLVKHTGSRLNYFSGTAPLNIFFLAGQDLSPAHFFGLLFLKPSSFLLASVACPLYEGSNGYSIPLMFIIHVIHDFSHFLLTQLFQCALWFKGFLYLRLILR